MSDTEGICGHVGLITLEQQETFIKEKNTVSDARNKCLEFDGLLEEVRQQLTACRRTMHQLRLRRERAQQRAATARQDGQPALHGFLRDQLAGLEANIAQQQRQKRYLAQKLDLLEKQAAESSFEEGRLVNIAYNVHQTEADFRQKKTAQRDCYIRREARLTRVYQDGVAEREQAQRRTLCRMEAREDRLRCQAEQAARRMHLHVAGTLDALRQQQLQQSSLDQDRRQRRVVAVRQFARQLEYTREVIRVEQQQPQQRGAEQNDEHRMPSAGVRQLQAMLQRRRDALDVQEQRRLAVASRQRENMRRMVATLVQEERRRQREVADTAAGSTRCVRQPHRHRSRSRRLPDSDADAQSDAGEVEVVISSTELCETEEGEGEAEADDEGGEEAELEEDELEKSGAAGGGGGGEVADDSTPAASRRGSAGVRGDVERDSSPLSISAEHRERLQTMLDSAVSEGTGADSLLASTESFSMTDVEQNWARARPSQPEQLPLLTSQPCPFSWKPDVIEFRDFQIGLTYHRRVAIVNLSATRSSCRYIGLHEQGYYDLYQPLAEMLKVKFTCPGFLGTGLSAKLELYFTPRLLTDGSCVLRFQAPSGEFHVPVTFVAQRCEPAIERQTADFGDLVLGSRVKKTILLRNTGKKGCRFTVRALEPTLSGQSEEGEPLSRAMTHSDTHRADTAGAQRTTIGPEIGLRRVTVTPPSDAGAGELHRLSLAEPVGDRRSFISPAISPSHRWSETASVSRTRPDSPRPADLRPRARELSPVSTVRPRVDSLRPGSGTPELPELPELRPDLSNVRSRADSLSASRDALGGDFGAISEERMQTPLSVIVSGGTSSQNSDEPAADSSAGLVSCILQQLMDRLPVIDFAGGLGVCGSGEGDLPARGRAKLHLGCVADLEGSWTQQFIVEFDDLNSPPFVVTASYLGHVFPVTVRNPHLSLDICLCGLAYWDNFEIVNRGKVASRVQTLIPEDIKPFVELQGSTALVQAGSFFKVKIHFKPKLSLLSPRHRFFDAATHVLEFPVVFRVEGRSVRGSVQAAVSSNRIWLRPERLNFGRVTLLESVCRRLQLTNVGLTLQRWQFTGLPDSVSVQPGDGGGQVLPGETMSLDVIFSPSVAGQHQFSLVMETLDGGKASVSCRGLATTPALSLNATSVKVSGAPVNGDTKAAIYLQCPKQPLDAERYFASGGSFQFQPPDDIPVRISPLVGFVPYKQIRRVDLTVSPRLEAREVRVAAALIQYQRLEQMETDRLQQEVNSKKTKRGGKTGRRGSAQRRQMVLCPEPDTIAGAASAIYREAEQLLERDYRPATRRYLVPCCVRHGPLEANANSAPDVLYLELVVTTAPPSLVAATPLCVEFGPRVLDATAHLPLELDNISAQTVEVRSAALDPHGPFRLVDPLGQLTARGRLSARLSFRPQRRSQELEFWEVRAGNCCLRYRICGRGVEPKFAVTPEDGVLTLPKAKLGGVAKKQILVTNMCEAPLIFDVELVLSAVVPSATGEPPEPPGKRPGSIKRGKPDKDARKAGASRSPGPASKPEPELAPLWTVSERQLSVAPGAAAALEVVLAPRDEGLYEADVVLRLFTRLDQVKVKVIGKTKGYKPPKPEKTRTDKSKGGKVVKQEEGKKAKEGKKK